MTDQQREERIKSLGKEVLEMYKQGKVDKSFLAFMEMQKLIKGRSVQQVRKMEQEKGLV